jgi:CheY-like chemotaxis protein
MPFRKVFLLSCRGLVLLSLCPGRLRWPIGESPQRARAAWVLMARAEASLGRILVVDDEPDLRYLLRTIFERAGHEVVEAGHGAAALKSVRVSPPDLVVTDMMMPVMGGFELIRRLRADPTTAQILVLAATGTPDLAEGADAVLTKPYQLDQLLATTNALLTLKADRT